MFKSWRSAAQWCLQERRISFLFPAPILACCFLSFILNPMETEWLPPVYTWWDNTTVFQRKWGKRANRFSSRAVIKEETYSQESFQWTSYISLPRTGPHGHPQLSWLGKSVSGDSEWSCHLAWPSDSFHQAWVHCYLNKIRVLPGKEEITAMVVAVTCVFKWTNDSKHGFCVAVCQTLF